MARRAGRPVISITRRFVREWWGRGTPVPMNPILRAVLVSVGWVSVGLGVVGMAVPLLPTTPFLLLAAYCFSRSSPRLRRWLLTNRWCGAYLDNYREGCGMSREEKLVTLAVLWITLTVTALTVMTAWWGRLLLLAVALGVTAHLVRIKTRSPESLTARTDAARKADGAGAASE